MLGRVLCAGRFVGAMAVRTGHGARRAGSLRVVKVPFLADSITQGTLGSWEKQVGEAVAQDEPVAQIETDKVTIPVNSPVAGVLVKHHVAPGDTVDVGAELFTLDTAATPSAQPESRERSSSTPPSTEGIRADETASKRKTDAEMEQTSGNVSTEQATSSPNGAAGDRTYTERMSRMRMRIAERMKEAQNTAASLTTFQDVDMSALVRLRKEHGKAFAERHGGVKLGFMSPFVSACASLLAREMPLLNARISPDGRDIVYSRGVDVSVAVATPRGLVTPVLRDAQDLTLGEIETWLARMAKKARENAITLDDLAGGTFTLSNGGVFGSLLGTPILNPPQSAVLGMHAIKDRPVVVDGAVVVRPMMYVALTYDHRLVDGREAVTFLVRLKSMLEDPALLALDS